MFREAALIPYTVLPPLLIRVLVWGEEHSWDFNRLVCVFSNEVRQDSTLPLHDKDASHTHTHTHTDWKWATRCINRWLKVGESFLD